VDAEVSAAGLMGASAAVRVGDGSAAHAAAPTNAATASPASVGQRFLGDLDVGDGRVAPGRSQNAGDSSVSSTSAHGSGRLVSGRHRRSSPEMEFSTSSARGWAGSSIVMRISTTIDGRRPAASGCSGDPTTRQVVM
jgi:hypothetical protein